MESSQKKLEQLKSLLRVCKAMASERNVNNLLKLIARETINIMDAERSSIFVVSPDSEHLETEVATGVDSEGIKIAKLSGIAGHVYKTGEIVNIEDAYKDNRFLSEIDKKTGFITRSMLAVPLINPQGGRRIGVFQVLNKRGSNFDGDDVEIIEAFAGQAAVAIINAREFEFLKKSEETLRRERTDLIRRLQQKNSTDNYIGVSEKTVELRKMIPKFAQTSASILIRGESGTGKDLMAKIIHHESARSNCPFVAINCAALPESLLESELFGIEEGVATGVLKREGKIECADKGTLFLDEIGDMSPPMQAKLLRVLQEREVEHVGGRKAIYVDIRVIAATNRTLEKLIEEGKFRSDLLYRLNTIQIEIPPLRERVEDIPVLAEYFLSIARQKLGKKIKRISPVVLKKLCAYGWPGNVRELENEIERASALTDADDEIKVDSVSPKIFSACEEEYFKTLEKAVVSLEKKMIIKALKNNDGNKSVTAKELGLSREGLNKKISRYNIENIKE
ncbi:MAG: sigma-54-dependent Fis family transcriptional regulator [Planctomycetota bacterium]